ncbi:hypothetical protein DFH08DRAFT_1054097 [Mycena albidolilacea]|uniref:Uncharacterized protein n=1 Tax=Mycena albidolilacea TaxID=1033008 RepID=A0AAD7EA33_9AGAR|nr:hypothetical protein DFH08DRAFT_1054097 [Mycena albidolilacea]
MAPKSNPEPKPVTGPPCKLIARIEHLQTLLQDLPTSLPENPPDSRYQFYLESDALEDRGYIGELSHALEVSFETYRLQGSPIRFLQRGSSLDSLPVLMKTAVKHMSSSNWEVFRKAWLERLINSAVALGAKIPCPTKRKAPKASEEPAPKKAKPAVIVLDDSDIDSDIPLASLPAPVLPSPMPHATPIPSTLSYTHTPIRNPIQTKLQFPKATKDNIQRYWTKVVANGAEKHQTSLEEKKQRDERKKVHERELGREQQRRKRARDKKDLPGKIPDSRNTNMLLMHGAAAVASGTVNDDMTDISRPATQAWKKS